MTNEKIAAHQNFLINDRSVIEARLVVDQEHIDVTTLTEPDPNWTFVDAAGHIHAYSKDFNLPTLRRVEVDAEQAPDDEFSAHFVADESDDDSWDEFGDDTEYTITEYHCVLCDETVVPGARSTVGRKFKLGRYSWRVGFTARVDDVLPLDRLKVSVWMTNNNELKAFGVGLLTVQSVDQQGVASGSILGEGELGQR